MYERHKFVICLCQRSDTQTDWKLMENLRKRLSFNATSPLLLSRLKWIHWLTISDILSQPSIDRFLCIYLKSMFMKSIFNNVLLSVKEAISIAREKIILLSNVSAAFFVFQRGERIKTYAFSDYCMWREHSPVHRMNGKWIGIQIYAWAETIFVHPKRMKIVWRIVYVNLSCTTE